MLEIVFPDRKPAIRTSGTSETICCVIRKRWIKLTPEEWVRQNFLLYLIDTLGYPPSLIAVEKKIVLGEVSKRFDIVVFNRSGQPYIIVECKEMGMPLNENVWLQALRYNSNLQARFLVITNGSYTRGFELESGAFTEIESISKMVSL